VTRRQIAARALAALLALVVCVYTGDFLVLRIRMLHVSPASPFESMTRTRILAIAQKGGKTDYQIDQVQPVETLICVHSLFPHYGDQPCWYLKPRLNQPITLN
jgi:hypothetical protein